MISLRVQAYCHIITKTYQFPHLKAFKSCFLFSLCGKCHLPHHPLFLSPTIHKGSFLEDTTNHTIRASSLPHPVVRSWKIPSITPFAPPASPTHSGSFLKDTTHHTIRPSDLLILRGSLPEGTIPLTTFTLYLPYAWLIPVIPSPSITPLYCLHSSTTPHSWKLPAISFTLPVSSLSHCGSFLDSIIPSHHSLFLSPPFTMAHSWKILGPNIICILVCHPQSL